jgi:hypothetical protein
MRKDFHTMRTRSCLFIAVLMLGAGCSWWDNDPKVIRQDAGASDGGGKLDVAAAEAGAAEAGAVDAPAGDGDIARVDSGKDLDRKLDALGWDVVFAYDLPVLEAGKNDLVDLDVATGDAERDVGDAPALDASHSEAKGDDLAATLDVQSRVDTQSGQ